MYYCSSYTGAAMFAMVESAFSRGFNVGCDTDDTSDWNLPESHAYMVMSTHVVTDASGTSHNLLRVRNPWGIAEYDGPWSDGSS